MAKRFEKAMEYTQKYKSVLLPCKWCENADVRIMSDRTILSNPKDCWFVSCQTPHCDCTGTYTSVKKAIEKWNEMHGKNENEADNNRPQIKEEANKMTEKEKYYTGRAEYLAESEGCSLTEAYRIAEKEWEVSEREKKEENQDAYLALRSVAVPS